MESVFDSNYITYDFNNIINVGLNKDTLNPFIGKVLTIKKDMILSGGVELDRKTLKPKESFIRLDYQF